MAYDEKQIEIIVKIGAPIVVILAPVLMTMILLAPNPEGPKHASTLYIVTFELVIIACWLYCVRSCHEHLGWFKFLDKLFYKKKE